MKKILLISLLWQAQGLLAFQAVNINQANAEQIALLPQVGSKLAHDIVVYRAQHGSFMTKAQLLKVSGMSDKKLFAINDLIVIDRKNSAAKNSKPDDDGDLVVLAPLPPLHELLESVLKIHDLPHDGDAKLAYRARHAAWLPKLSAGLNLDHERDVAEKFGDGGRDSRMTRGGRDVGFGIRLTFDFDKLIFNTDELEVAKLSLRRQEARQALIKELHEHYFTYVRLYESAKKPLAKHEAQSLMLEARQALAKLDAMSNNTCSKFMNME